MCVCACVCVWVGGGVCVYIRAPTHTHIALFLPCMHRSQLCARSAAAAGLSVSAQAAAVAAVGGLLQSRRFEIQELWGHCVSAFRWTSEERKILPRIAHKLRRRPSYEYAPYCATPNTLI